MSILSRVADLFQAKTNTLLNILENPNETLELSYERMLTGLQETKSHLADVVAQQVSLERQMASVEKEIGEAEQDAATAVKAGREDLARAALVHRRRAIDTHETLRAARDAIMPQVDKLSGYQQQLEQRIEDFRTQKETMKASYAAAKAQVQVTQSITGVGNQLGRVGNAYNRAEDKMLAMRDKADAMDSMIQRGLLTDPLDKRDAATREIAQLRSAHAVDDDLAQLKQQLGFDAKAALPPPE
jgi:phage shock protein A